MGYFLRFLRSGIWLWLPPLGASFAFWPNLGPAYQPDAFWLNIPPMLGFVENTSRFFVIAVSSILLLGWKSNKQRIGWVVYFFGLALYTICQWVIVLDPTGGWPTSVFGFMAPAYTPAIWIIGLGMIGTRNIAFGQVWVRWLYWIAAVVFIASHNAHAWLIFSRSIAG